MHDDNKVTKSVSTGKLTGICTINTDPQDNIFCTAMEKRGKNDKNLICGQCYAFHNLRSFRKSCTPRFRNNGRLLRTKLNDSQLPSFSPGEIVRLSGYGEIHNLWHVENYFRMAEIHPHATFVLFTKRSNLVKKWLNCEKPPENMILIRSSFKINIITVKPPFGFHKIFNVFTAEYAAEHKVDINCYGNCASCMRCYRKDGPSVINEVIINQKGAYDRLRHKI